MTTGGRLISSVIITWLAIIRVRGIGCLSRLGRIAGLYRGCFRKSWKLLLLAQGYFRKVGNFYFGLRAIFVKVENFYSGLKAVLRIDLTLLLKLSI